MEFRLCAPVILLSCAIAFSSSAAPALGEDCGPLPAPPAPPAEISLKLMGGPADLPLHPVLSLNTPGAEHVVGGFEGGTVVKERGIYYLFTTEMLDGLSTAMGLWTSSDGQTWRRKETLFASSKDFTGADIRAGLWAPMPVYDEARNRWDLFYVAYRSKPDTADAWYANYDGRIVRAESTIEGRKGLVGPYRDISIILKPDENSDPWEGLQGVDSIFPYPAGGRWFGFYGTAHTEKKPITSWQVGLAAAPSLAGPWKRCTALNPVPIQTRFIENPVVSRIGRLYLAIYDVDIEKDNAIGYAVSSDGIHWQRGKQLVLFREGTATARTPLALIPEPDGNYSLFLTAKADLQLKGQDGKSVNAGSVFRFKVQVTGVNPK